MAVTGGSTPSRGDRIGRGLTDGADSDRYPCRSARRCFSKHRTRVADVTACAPGLPGASDFSLYVSGPKRRSRKQAKNASLASGNGFADAETVEEATDETSSIVRAGRVGVGEPRVQQQFQSEHIIKWIRHRFDRSEFADVDDECVQPESGHDLTRRNDH